MPTISESDDEVSENTADSRSTVGSAALMGTQNPPDKEGKVGGLAALMGTQASRRQVGELAALMGTQAIRKQNPEQPDVAGSLRLFRERDKETLNYVGANGWEEIELAVDSGASETVVGPAMAQSADLQEGNTFKRNKVYEMADGVTIPNLGEKEFVGVSKEGIKKELRAQVCDINKGLLSVNRVVDAGNRVVFSPDGSYIEDSQGRKCV